MNGGFGNGGTTFVGKGFAVPAAGACKVWTGYLKTASSVIAHSTGSGCLSSDGIVLTLSILSTDPSFLGSGETASDHIRICPGGSAGCPTGVGVGTACGTFGGNAAKTACTTALLDSTGRSRLKPSFMASGDAECATPGAVSDFVGVAVASASNSEHQIS